jgi:L-aminopeptidase/D-esterase-like protein
VVATDARLTKRDAKRLAVMAHDGFARAVFPVHTPIDGDIVFSIATGLVEAAPDIVALGSAAAVCVARAIARGVYEAAPAPGDVLPTWRQRFG